jgi:maleylpyruvate isomerase
MTETNSAVLYGYFRSSASYRVRIALALKGLSVRHKSVHLPGGEQNMSNYLRVNPAGLVPAWIDGDLRLSQSIAIIEYLDEIHPQPPLLPDHAAMRAIAREIAMTIVSDVHPIGNLRVLNRLTELGVDETSRVGWLKHWIIRGFETIEARLVQLPGPFSIGDRPTLADVCIVPQVFSARRYGVDLAPFKRILGVDVAAGKLDAFAVAAPGSQPDAE